jgi:hypothetical protein
MLYITGCTVYMPQPIIVPLFSNKHEFQANLSTSIIPSVSSSIAYSPLKHIGVQAYGLIAPDKIHYYQASGGYYWKSGSGMTMEIYGGFGAGQGMIVKNSDNSTLSGDYSVSFLQYNLGQTGLSSKNIDYGFAIKAGMCEATITDKGYYDITVLNPIINVNHYYLIEPSAFIRFGKKKLRTGIQLNGASFINVNVKQKQMPSRPITIGFSMNYKISGK